MLIGSKVHQTRQNYSNLLSSTSDEPMWISTRLDMFFVQSCYSIYTGSIKLQSSNFTLTSNINKPYFHTTITDMKLFFRSFSDLLVSRGPNAGVPNPGSQVLSFCKFWVYHCSKAPKWNGLILSSAAQRQSNEPLVLFSCVEMGCI